MAMRVADLAGVVVGAFGTFWVSWVVVEAEVAGPVRGLLFGVVDRGVVAGGWRAGLAGWVGGLLGCRACFGWWVSVPVSWAAFDGLWGWVGLAGLLAVNGAHLLLVTSLGGAGWPEGEDI